MLLKTVSLFIGMNGIRPTRSLSARSASSNLPTTAELLQSLVGGSESETFAVYDPSTLDTIIAQVPVMGKADAEEAILRSTASLKKWRDETTAAARGSLLTAWSKKLKEKAESLATIMTLESGKPVVESRGEVAYAASFLDYYAAEAVRPSGAGGGFLVPTPFTEPCGGKPRGQVMAIHQAVGVSAMISPWNFPLAMVRNPSPPFRACQGGFAFFLTHHDACISRSLSRLHERSDRPLQQDVPP
jgi:succinate-semialdehyde dehydrogenase/glutarate-semialdehyde dehydrogenase